MTIRVGNWKIPAVNFFRERRLLISSEVNNSRRVFWYSLSVRWSYILMRRKFSAQYLTSILFLYSRRDLHLSISITVSGPIRTMRRQKRCSAIIVAGTLCLISRICEKRDSFPCLNLFFYLFLQWWFWLLSETIHYCVEQATLKHVSILINRWMCMVTWEQIVSQRIFGRIAIDWSTYPLQIARIRMRNFPKLPIMFRVFSWVFKKLRNSQGST